MWRRDGLGEEAAVMRSCCGCVLVGLWGRNRELWSDVDIVICMVMAKFRRVLVVKRVRP